MILSVIIVSHNTKELLAKTLDFVNQRLGESFNKKNDYEVIVVDNASTDGTQSMLKDRKIQSILLPHNIGFGNANNRGARVARGTYLLLLNSDVLLTEPVGFEKLIEFLYHDEKKSALTIKLMLDSAHMDPACHRGFPTVWNAFAYFTGLEKITRNTPLARLFGGYHLTTLSLDTIHEIDCPSAAFFLIKRRVFEKEHGFDPDYFFYAEDIDLCYRLKKNGGSIFFYPHMSALHLKYQSGMAKNGTTSNTAKQHFFSSMLLFYEKHYFAKYPRFIHILVRGGVRVLAFMSRIFS
ncbi:MAG: glycosyltransferase family 2 protein [Candidatus Roizmanbacteria bacterium]|nr:glycosyltransferase family 2 protein [Candidatus Roizmanbacteria bacterium]